MSMPITETVARTASLLLLTMCASTTAAAGQTPPPSAGGNTGLEETHWRAIEVSGRAVPEHDPKRDAYLHFQPGDRVAGSDGCNRITGSYQLNGDRVRFDRVAATQMACTESQGIEGPFQEALTKASRLTINGDRLELLDSAGLRVAVFSASPPAPAASPSSGLAGTAWQLVKFESSDDTTLTPDDSAKYTIEFAGEGVLSARIDCNSGRGTWKSAGPSEIAFGPLALTRKQCAPGSLHDQIVKQWGNIRSYVIRDGHLFLALLADGGIYEFAPIASRK
jgi:heat shock protein HslJ